MSERAIVYFSERNSKKEEYIEIIIENFPLVPTGSDITIYENSKTLFEAKVSFYCVTNRGLEVDAGEVISTLFQDMLSRSKEPETEGHRYRYPNVITLG